MEVMFDDMERTLGKQIALPVSGMTKHESYRDQIVVDSLAVGADEGDEAVDMAYQSPDESPHLNESVGELTLYQAFGSQFATDKGTHDLESEQDADDLAREISVDSSVSDYCSSHTQDLDGMSQSTDPSESAPPPLPPRQLGELKLDDVAERWTHSQMSRQNLDKNHRNVHNIPRKPVQGGVRAQC